MRDKQKQARDDAIQRLADKGKTQQEIAEELQIGQGTVSRIIQNQQMVKVDSEPESEAELEIEPLVEETAEEPEAADPELPEADETAAEEEVEVSEQDPQLETDETSAAEEEPVTLEPDPETRTRATAARTDSRTHFQNSARRHGCLHRDPTG